MTIQVMKIFGDVELPRYATAGSAGFDLKAHNFKKVSRAYNPPSSDTDLIAIPEGTEVIELRPGCRILIGTGLKVALPVGNELDIRPRSGLALKNGITVLNAPGTIDSDYRDEVGVILINQSTVTYVISKGDRIAQAVVVKYERVRFDEVENLDETDRKGGFGHTGM
jgi:dUTP pyrophosphatase